MPQICVVGAGVAGTRAILQLTSIGHNQLAVFDKNQSKANELANTLSDQFGSVRPIASSDLTECEIVILACAQPHLSFAKSLIERGVSVVSLSDNLADVRKLLELHAQAKASEAVLVVGAAASPGLSALLVCELRKRFDTIDEVHVASHGTGGPNCAHQHHDALSGQSIGWHDDDWLRRPAGSGRELCWFPGPVGAYDCYRAEMSDPVLLKHAMPQLQRITARMSATRRDRFTARLPMMAPPHAEGGMGSVRVEVRGWRSGSRAVEIIGVAERVGQIAGVVAGTVAHEIAIGGITEHGVVTLGSPTVPNERLLAVIQRSGIQLHEFVGD